MEKNWYKQITGEEYKRCYKSRNLKTREKMERDQMTRKRRKRNTESRNREHRGINAEWDGRKSTKITSFQYFIAANQQQEGKKERDCRGHQISSFCSERRERRREKKNNNLQLVRKTWQEIGKVRSIVLFGTWDCHSKSESLAIQRETREEKLSRGFARFEILNSNSEMKSCLDGEDQTVHQEKFVVDKQQK